MSFESFYLPLVLIGLLVVLAIACNPFKSGKKAGNMVLTGKETALDDLDPEARVLLVLVTNARDRGLYWLDLDRHELYLAKKLHSNVVPGRGDMTWTGTQVVYGYRMAGFFSLDPDGSHRQITDFDHMGQIARDGERILRFTKCDPDETGAGYAVTPLDHAREPLLICLPRPSSGLESWYSIHPVWNPDLAQADFVASKRSGQGKDRVVESTRLVQVSEDGSLETILDLGTDFSLENATLYFQPRPDGEAFYVHDRKLGTGRIVSRRGDVLVDIAALDAQLPHLQRTGRFSWSPDSRKAVFLYRDCRRGRDDCDDVLVLATHDFEDLVEITTLPAKLRFNRFIWSPESTFLGLVTDIHQGKDDPPRVLAIRLEDQSVAEYAFPSPFILRDVQWLR